MSELHNQRDDRPFDSFESLESIVRAAGGYVQPTDDLRPRTLEAARDACAHRRWNRRLGAMATAVVALALCGPLSRIAPSRAGQAEAPSEAIRSYDLHHEASLRTARSGLDPSWALYDAFAELRKKQADLFDAAM